MGTGTLSIYSASAGSGKTYRLTGIYLKSLFRSRFSYRRILAVTFTHKATAEMKSRILDSLNKLASGESCEYLAELVEETNKPEEWIRSEAKEILNAILHDFSRFSVSTIDSFFQKILRAFAREAGLHAGFNIELDHSTILSDAVDEMIASSVSDPLLLEWLTTYAMSNIDDEKSWNLKEGIVKLGQELFKEKFKILSADERLNLEDKNFLLEYIKKVKTITSSFEKKWTGYGAKCNEIYARYELSDDMFYRKGQGVPRFIKILTSGVVAEPNRYVLEVLNDPPRWSTAGIAPQLQQAIQNGLEKYIKEALGFYKDNILEYNSATVILSNIYALGILSDVLYNVHVITNSENSFLLSDAGEVLNLITRGDQAPFIYEKAGNRYENFMIDEFQDTSIIQWNNFRPLFENSMAGGFDNLVVGDIKQSIYRWRNSDWQILGRVLKQSIDNERIISKPLTTNWRSRTNLIKFNNTLFSVIPSILDETLSDEVLPVSFKNIYSEAVQVDPGKKSGGYVRLEFIQNEKERKWQDVVTDRLPGIIESFQDKGYDASDIGIIVRDGKEGALVLKTVIDYSNNCSADKKKKYNYNVVSNDSLLLSNSPAINFIIAVLSVVNDPGDMIARALMLRLFLLSKGDTQADKVALINGTLIEESTLFFPSGYEDFLSRVRQLPLFEATEGVIKFFGLGEHSWNVAYLNTFQDFVVSFTDKKNADFQSFLDWWNTTGIRKSVVLPGNQEAMRILTIHKSKGLEFKVVILPFLSWNLDHIASKQPFLWVKPAKTPFDDLGIVPVKYSKELLNTIFDEEYKDEKYSVYLDNINLLYVALTRAKDAIYSFSVDNPKFSNTIAGVLKDAITVDTADIPATGLSLNKYYNTDRKIFEFGEIPENKKGKQDNVNITSTMYSVSSDLESLRLKLHGENYFSAEDLAVRKKINYGKLMHEVFEGIETSNDVRSAVKKLVLEGKLAEEESGELESNINHLINTPGVAEWFYPGNKVMNEAGILLPSGITRRPDRVIIKDGKATIIDFKFGEENSHYLEQVEQYRHLLIEMGFASAEAFIWYVDKNKIVSA